ncbi:MAG: hypothetical protein NTW05_22690, partial [Pseudonocardiales bacterium]|nr:hypothetical protein [Pseudonocardiales bacterium]
AARAARAAAEEERAGAVADLATATAELTALRARVEHESALRTRAEDEISRLRADAAAAADLRDLLATALDARRGD